ncbi:MAG: hypothetical protein CMP10_04010 [Zetaproteobacteria bacterium]|nr:hypothetical protein [Pseudobdellovibrionaceae bacterium]|tara:strand:- start:80 stop:352 length:273 start_codon:yes stop_codon:yes gene_type:complete
MKTTSQKQAALLRKWHNQEVRQYCEEDHSEDNFEDEAGNVHCFCSNKLIKKDESAITQLYGVGTNNHLKSAEQQQLQTVAPSKLHYVKKK